MNEKIKQFTARLKSPKALMCIGLCGILLIGISALLPKSDSTVSVKETAFSAQTYQAQLEERVKKTVTQITGSANVTVLITLESGIRYSYAELTEGADENKSDSSSESYSSEKKQTYITVKNASGGEQALLITEEMPEIRGIAIVCEGGDNEETAEKIKNAVMAAFNITSKRVYVAGGAGYEKR